MSLEQINKTESKRKAKRACVDCHYLMLIQLGREHFEYPDLDVIPSIVSRNQVPLSIREQIKKKENFTFESPFDGYDYVLGCYSECWSELQPDAYKKRYETVVEADRNDCIFFFDNNPAMSFKAAEKMQERVALSQSSQNIKKEKTRKACIGCHFLGNIPRLDCGIPPVIGINDNGDEIYNDMKIKIVDSIYRDSILNYPMMHFNNLGCYRELWTLTDDNNDSLTRKLYETVVETNRSDCVFFIKYYPGMSFDNAKEMQDRMTLLKSIQDKEQINKAETVVVPDQTITGNDNYIFRKDGERWYIKFENEVLKPENLDGLRFMHYLMESNNKPITPKKLYQAVKGIKKSYKDEEGSVETYTLNPRKIEKAQLGELKEHHSNIEIKQFINEHEKIDKTKIKKLAKDLKEAKEILLNKKSELEEEGRFSEAEDVEIKINDTQQKINIVTRIDHDPEYKQYYDRVSKAIKKAKEKIMNLSNEKKYDSLLTWNHFEESIDFDNFHYFYKPTTPISWEL